MNPSFSYFDPPISNTAPCKNTTLDWVSGYVKSDPDLALLTEKVRSGKADKKKILPFITCSGTFIKRNMGDLIEYSGIVGIDLDDVADLKIRRKLAMDNCFPLSFLFVSPSGKGLKLFYLIQNASKENHLAYFLALSTYLFDKYTLVADKSCKDIPRPCFLCADPKAFYFPSLVRSDDLLSYFHQHCEDGRPQRAAPTGNEPSVNRYFQPASHPTELSDPLNNNLHVHQKALSALRTHGWKQTGRKNELWIRPGKAKGHSAIYNENNGRYVFTVFSSNAYPFDTAGYSDVGVIAFLDFNKDYAECFKSLRNDLKI